MGLQNLHLVHTNNFKSAEKHPTLPFCDHRTIIDTDAAPTFIMAVEKHNMCTNAFQ